MNFEGLKPAFTNSIPEVSGIKKRRRFLDIIRVLLMYAIELYVLVVLLFVYCP